MPVEKFFRHNDHRVIAVLRTVYPFAELSMDELIEVTGVLRKYAYRRGELVINEGETGTTAFIVYSGTFSLEIMGRVVRTFKHGDFFGEIALIDNRPRMGTVRALGSAALLVLDGKDLDDETRISSRTAKKIFKGFSRLVTTYLREGANLYEKMDILLLQEGGCAPGYNPVTAFISEYLEKADREVYICAEGFRSLLSNQTQDYRRLIYNPDKYRKMEQLPGVLFSPPLRESRGADFRSERFPQFDKKDNQLVAARNIVSRQVRVFVGIGGNGTFAGTKSLSRLLPDSVQVFFIPVTIDSDIYGTDCIGEYTGVEIGAEKIRCYMADSRTHKRIYIIEMMGAHGGYHALHSCLGAGAHLAVLPSSDYDMPAVARALEKRENAVIVVAEGYKVEQRKRAGFKGNAADYFYRELISAGLKTDQRVICEPFSRDIRGAAPNNLDLMLAQRMARTLLQMIQNGESQKMPAVLSGRDYSIPFDEIRTDNSVESALATLANRLVS